MLRPPLQVYTEIVNDAAICLAYAMMAKASHPRCDYTSPPDMRYSHATPGGSHRYYHVFSLTLWMQEDPIAAAQAFLRGYHAVYPLQQNELQAHRATFPLLLLLLPLWHLFLIIVSLAAVVAVSVAAGIHPHW